MIPLSPSRYLYIKLPLLLRKVVNVIQLPRVEFIPPVFIGKYGDFKIRRASCLDFESVPEEGLNKGIGGCCQGFCIDAVDTESVVRKPLGENFIGGEFIWEFDVSLAAEGLV